ncbi:molybdenum cofactor guanylyltransferase [Vibrio sp.]|nr:molybdenum cofactor guanylyltransferase [Vibrio sp.]
MDQHSGVVLAGGLSSRMGRDKSQLEWNGESLLQHSYKVLAASYCHYIYVSNNRGEGIQDRYLECGPLGGIDATLSQMSNQGWLTVLPVDMPLIDTYQLKQLQTFASDTGKACYFKNHFLPCVLPVNETVKDYLKQQLENQGDFRVKGLLSFVHAVEIEPVETISLMNTNTPEEWESAIQVRQEYKKENQYVRS